MDLQRPLKAKDDSKKSWSLEAIQTLTHRYSSIYKNIESVIERPEDPSPVVESMLQFQEATGLEQIHDLLPGISYQEHPESLPFFMQALAPYFLSGFIFECGQNANTWWVTGFCFKGQRFDLQISDQIRISQKLPYMSPLQVKRAPTERLMKQYHIDFVPVPSQAQSFLFRPTHVTGLLLNTESPELFAKIKIDAALKLMNRYFNV